MRCTEYESNCHIIGTQFISVFVLFILDESFLVFIQLTGEVGNLEAGKNSPCPFPHATPTFLREHDRLLASEKKMPKPNWMSFLLFVDHLLRDSKVKIGTPL